MNRIDKSIVVPCHEYGLEHTLNNPCCPCGQESNAESASSDSKKVQQANVRDLYFQIKFKNGCFKVCNKDTKILSKCVIREPQVKCLLVNADSTRPAKDHSKKTMWHPIAIRRNTKKVHLQEEFGGQKYHTKSQCNRQNKQNKYSQCYNIVKELEDLVEAELEIEEILMNCTAKEGFSAASYLIDRPPNPIINDQVFLGCQNSYESIKYTSPHLHPNKIPTFSTKNHDLDRQKQTFSEHLASHQ
ncbi:unnamed protein product [Moneuplotes crassus]|uniref:Uncharacterized protein n=1 Tax=Euplotes crassus TaxID=5936 RepID=A0AAD2CY04_EUPCR|nr:unnamed protein product [Moneuplotes crassus]